MVAALRAGRPWVHCNANTSTN